MKAVVAFLLVLCCLAVSHAWRCNPGPLLSHAVQIDAGQGKVVAVNKYGQVFFLAGTRWAYMYATGFRHVTVGQAGLWGCTTTNRVSKYVAGKFVQSSGLTFHQVDAGGQHLVGVQYRYNRAYCANRHTALFYRQGTVSWRYQSRTLRYYSCRDNSCWGVDTHNRVYFIQSLNPGNCATGSWKRVPGPAMKMIEVGSDGTVFAVTHTGQLFQGNGHRWTNVPVCMSIRHVTYDLGVLWAVTTSGVVLRCTH